MLSSILQSDFIWEPNQMQSSKNSGEDNPFSAAFFRASSSKRAPVYLHRQMNISNKK